MKEKETKYFELLKKEVVLQLKSSLAISSDNWKKWSIDDINNLQIDLEDKTKGRFSEKWFYTHFKSESNNLPRIDMLNLFSRYIGYENWNTFLQKSKPVNKKRDKKRYSFVTPLIIVFLIIIIVGFLFMSNVLETERNQFNFCFYDIYKNTAITNGNLLIEIQVDNESPIQLKCDSNGCFNYKTLMNSIEFRIGSKKYKNQHVYRSVINHQSEIIHLQSNDYALMLDYFTNSKIDDWNKRQFRLKKLINDNVDILQMNENLNSIIQIYDKEEFVRKISIPTESLKKIQILEIKYEKDQIIFIRFVEAS